MDDEGYLLNITERTHISKSRDAIYYQDENEKLISINEQAIASMNLMGFTPSIFNHLNSFFKKFIHEFSYDLKNEFYLPTMVNEIIRMNIARVKILNTNDNWFGVTYKEDKVVTTQKILELVKNETYPENLWNIF